MGSTQAYNTLSSRTKIGIHLAGLLLLAVARNSSCASLGVQTTVSPNNDIIIDSLTEDGKTPSTGERHLYEPQIDQQQPVSSSATPVQQAEDLASKDKDLKAEPRNQEEQLEPVIVDHRPSGESQQEPQVQQQATDSLGSTTQSPVYQPTTQAALAQQFQISAPSNIQQQQQGAFTQSPALPSQNQQQQFGQQTGNAQSFTTTSSGPQAASSNQVYTIQHPTSINSIINDQQNQQQQQQQQAIGSTTNLQNSVLTPAAINGQQPNSLILQVSPNAQIANGQGRRISISNWLKGISSMLANIFNRREHGTLALGGSPLVAQQGNIPQQQQPSQPQASGSSSIGHWLQLGPNAPHWLTQAQSLIHQQQYHHQFNMNSNPLAPAASSARFTFVQAPQQQVPQTMTITMQPGTIVGNGQYQQQQSQSGTPGQDAMVASGSSPASYMTMIQPSVTIGQVAQPQQQQQQPQAQSQLNPQLPTGNISSPNTSQLQQQSLQITSTRQQAVPTSSSQQQNVSGQASNNSNNQHQATRFGRSSTPTQALSGNQNLPLAHYTRLASV